MEQPVDHPTSQPEWFENFIAHYETANPQQGEILQATIVRNDQDGVFLDLGLKREIVVPQRDLEHLDREVLEKLTPGSQVPVVVVSQATENREIEVSLSRGLEQQVWEKAKKDMESGEIFSLEVIDHNRGGLIVRYEDLRGFVPYSLVPELRGVRNPKRAEAIKNGLIGKPIDVKITEVDPERRRLILSAESAQAELRQKMLDKYKKGQVIVGKVVKVVDFGAFVDLDGIDGLIHVSQLSWKKVKHPGDVIKVGDEVEVKIIEMDRERQRIGLSRKAMLPGPWQTIGEELKAGDYIEGIVTRLVDFGAFAKIPQGVEGLIHTSQIGYSSHQDPQNAIKPGDRVLLKVLDVKPEKKRVALSMRQVPMERQMAWMENLERSSAQQQEQEAEVEETKIKEPVEVETAVVLTEDESPAEVETEATLRDVVSPPEIEEEVATEDENSTVDDEVVDLQSVETDTAETPSEEMETIAKEPATAVIEEEQKTENSASTEPVIE